MAIGNFISEGIVFHNHGKMDVSLALICSALDVTAKKVFPNETDNSKRNKKFMKEYMHIITRFGFPGIITSKEEIRIKCVNVPNLKPDNEGYVGIEDIIYHTIRCGLIHECDIEQSIEFTDETLIGDFINKFKVPKQLFWGLTLATILCEKNKEEVSFDKVIKLGNKDFQIGELWGKEHEIQRMIDF